MVVGNRAEGRGLRAEGEGDKSGGPRLRLVGGGGAVGGGGGFDGPPVLRVFYSRFGAGEDGGGHAPKLTRKERRRQAMELATGAAAKTGWGGGKRCADDRANQQVYLCCVPREGAVLLIGRSGGRGPGLKMKGRALDRKGAEARTVATRDPSDRAHGIKDDDGFLVSALYLGKHHAQPRRYPRSQMTSRGVAFDSAFDAWHDRRLRLEGVEGVGLSRSRAAGGSSGASVLETLRQAGYEAAKRGKTLRAVLERNVEGVEGRLESAEKLLARYRKGEWRAEE